MSNLQRCIVAYLKADISIIIASHNRLWALPQAIDSCRNSNCRTEIIVVDDGSTDGTWSWLQTQEDVVSIKTDNWGKCWAINAGFAASTGEFIRFLDSDDWLLGGANDRQLEIARATQADVVVAGHIYLVEETGKTEEVTCTPFHDFLTQYIDMVSLGIDCIYSAYLMRRSLVASIPHRQEFPWDDIMFMIEVGLANPNVVACDSPSVVYRQHHRDRRLSNNTGFDQTYEVWRTIAMYMKTLTLLHQRGELTISRKHAVLAALWLEARKLAHWNMKEATELVVWIYHQDDKLTPPVSRLISRLYRTIGFAMAERIAWVRRILLHAVELRRHLP